MPKEFDHQLLNTTIIRVVTEAFKKLLRIDPGSAPVAVERDIIEFDSHMRVFPMEKFNGPVIVTFVNFFLNQKDLDDNAAVGAFVLFVKEELAEKLLKAFDRPLTDGDSEDVLMDNAADFCALLAGNLKNELAASGCADLLMSAPFKYKNSVPEGVPFDYELHHKQEITFSYWNQKSVVIEACMGYVPQK